MVETRRQSEKKTMLNEQKSEKLILFLFFLSGAAALIYQVISVRMLSLVFGSTTYSVAIVLAAFMLGFALGSWYFGRLVDRLNLHLSAGYYFLCGYFLILWLGVRGTLYMAGIINLMIGFMALLFTGGFRMFFSPLRVYANTSEDQKDYCAYEKQNCQWVHTYSSCLLGAIPTNNTTINRIIPCINATLEIFSGVVIRPIIRAINIACDKLSVTLANSFRWLLSNFIIYIIQRIKTFIKSRRIVLQIHGETAKAEKPFTLYSSRLTVLLTIALSGFTALAYEVLWTRTLNMILGSSVYAFTTMLCSFLVGIALGSLIYTKLGRLICNIHYGHSFEGNNLRRM